MELTTSAVLGLLFGSMIAWLVLRSKAAASNARLSLIEKELSTAKADLARLQQAHTELVAGKARLESALESERKTSNEKIELVTRASEELRNAFKAMAADALKSNNQQFLALARENQKKAGVENVEFLKGAIENIPLPENTVDVIISNCVINLSGDKDRVLREAFRVLKPGGRFAVSDVVVRGHVPDEVRRSMELWVGCIAGALEETEYIAKLRTAGFSDAEIEPWRVYQIDDARSFLAESGLNVDQLGPTVKDTFASAFIRARKPETISCCGPTCCTAL